MDPRSSNTLSKDSANNGNNYRQATFFGAAALVGTLSGLRHAGTDHILARIPFTFKKAEFPLAYASVSALVAAVGFYFVKNLDWHSKPETKSQAAITALTIGATTLAGWTSMRYFGSKFMFRGLTEKRLNLAMIMTAAGGGLAGFGLPAFIHKLQNGYQKVEELIYGKDTVSSF